MVALVPILGVIAGALLYGLASNPKVAEIGRLIFAASMLALMLAWTGHSIRLF